LDHVAYLAPIKEEAKEEEEEEDKKLLPKMSASSNNKNISVSSPYPRSLL